MFSLLFLLISVNLVQLGSKFHIFLVLGETMLCLATLVCIGFEAAIGDNEIFLF